MFVPGRYRTHDPSVRQTARLLRSAALTTSRRSNYVGYDANIMLKLTSMSTTGGCGLNPPSADGDQWRALVSIARTVRVPKVQCDLVTYWTMKQLLKMVSIQGRQLYPQHTGGMYSLQNDSSHVPD
jgi:hypothetical protein